MKKLEVHIQHIVLWQFKNDKNATETVQICMVFTAKVSLLIRNWFSMFRSGDMSLRVEPRPGHFNQDALRKLVEYNPLKSIQSISTCP